MIKQLILFWQKQVSPVNSNTCYNYVLDEIFGVHEAKTDFGQKKQQIIFPIFGILVYPFQQHVPNTLFPFHIQLIIFDYYFEFFLSEFHQLVALFRYGHKFFDDVFVRRVRQRSKVIVTAG